ncbi:MAG: nucleoside-diphosphate sugar epimerase/dehydratase [Lachnospiraceae bacterium]
MKKTDGLKIPLYRIALLIMMDVMLIVVSSFFSLYLRYEFSISSIDKIYVDRWLYGLPVYIILTLVVFWACKLYKSVWRYASATELVNIGCATIISAAGVTIYCLTTGNLMPRSFYFLNWFFLFWGACAIRFSYRILRMVQERRLAFRGGNVEKRILIVGAGAAGNSILKEIQSSLYVKVKVCCIIDDQPGCHGKMLRGVPIVGDRYKILESVEEYQVDEIIIAIPTASRKEVKGILDICAETSCKLRMLPGMYQLINGEVSIAKLKEVQIEDLLGRDPIEVDTAQILNEIRGKRILVTGGGGSIGSELCRQIAAHEPEMLLVLDIYENNLYEIQQELLRSEVKVNLVALIASVRNTKRMEAIFEKYKPEIVFHAAAHKHVPLMEESPHEAIKNNVFGTYKTAQAAGRQGTSKFILISTDKAVNPTNVMGASKRLCEMVIQHMNRNYSKTDYVAVRFGNVLGSNGSVIPLFKKQIEQGGPVTVTHPDIIRYFMTIPEAVSLVLQASYYAKGGEVFVLDMGEPVKILDLATNLIRLSGYRVGEDIEIKFTGLRPGEKMFEELLLAEEGLQKTANKKIYIGNEIEFEDAVFEKYLRELRDIVDQEDTEYDIREKIHQAVPTYVPSKEESKENENYS